MHIYSEFDSIEKYYNVFKMIFEKTGHKNHFDMMNKKINQ
jgi:hypothetical protein